VESADPFKSLRDALRISPDNVPLRHHLADSLLKQGLAEEAEVEYREALTLAPQNHALKLGLALAFLKQSKATAALVVLEDLIKQRDCPAQARVHYAKLLFQRGDVLQAVAEYKLAIEHDSSAADSEFAKTLGINDHSPHAEVTDGRVRSSWDSPQESELREIERPKIDFSHIGGMHAVKDEIRIKIIHPLNHPELYKAYGKTVGGGILMYGPPGCGKTHLARATAGEIKAGFIAIGVNDVLDMWIGNSEKRLHSLFEQARDNAPCVLFFDEVDALGAKRTDMQHSAGRHLINQFLSEMDGIASKNDGVLILAATNSPWHIDPAFRRPGRFDRILFVPPPDNIARAEILQIHTKDKPIQDLNFQTLAAKTENYSGADLKAVIDLAVEAKLREAIKSGKLQPLTHNDLTLSCSQIRPSTKEWFATARNHALYANQGGMYDDILKYLKLT
jgi:transitional endoplasmic reticulum ATPase